MFVQFMKFNSSVQKCMMQFPRSNLSIHPDFSLKNFKSKYEMLWIFQEVSMIWMEIWIIGGVKNRTKILEIKHNVS